MATMDSVHIKQEVRILMISNPNDFDAERFVIHDNVIPAIRQFCHDEFNLDFVLLDPLHSYPGLKQAAQNNLENCSSFLDDCLKYSDGPGVVVLLGDKYGANQVPKFFQITHFELLLNELKETNNANWITLQKRYSLSQNQFPAVYVLNSLGFDAVEENVLLSVIAETGKSLVAKELMEQNVLDSYIKSDMNKLIEKVVQDRYSTNMSIVFMRQIKDFEYWAENLADEYFKPRFCDCKADGQIDKTLHPLVDELKEMICNKLPRENYVKIVLNPLFLSEMKEFLLSKTKLTTGNRNSGLTTIVKRLNELNVVQELTSQDYISVFAKQFYEKLKHHIVRLVRKREYFSDKLYKEIGCHQSILECHDYPTQLYNRERELKIIDNYLTSQTSRTPGMLYGESGMGKTTLLKYALMKIDTLFPNVKSNIIIRCAGRSCNSSTLQAILASMTEELARSYKELFNKPFEYASCVYDFWRILQLASARHPIFILMDDVDQLFPQSHTEMYRWLPHRLPSHVKVLLTTNHENLYTGFKRRYDESSAVTVAGLAMTTLFNELPMLMQNYGKEADEKSLKLANHLLQQNSQPLYLQVLANVLPVKEEKLPDRTKLIFMKLIEQVEQQLGTWLVKYVLSYIVASRFGVSLQELADLMSLDNGVTQESGLDIKLASSFRFPIFLILKVLKSMERFLFMHKCEERLLYSCKHEVIRSAIQDYYQLNKEFGVYIHSQLVDYWLGRWGGGKPKPLFDKMTETDDSNVVNLDRQAPLIPYYWLSNGVLTCDARKLGSLPFHLMKSERTNDLFRLSLFAFEFLYAKLSMTCVNDLLSEIYFVRQVYEVRVNNEVEVLIAFLRLLAPVLEKDTDLLGTEICGRLCHLVGHQPLLTSLIQQTDVLGFKVNSLIPTVPCYPTLDADEVRVQLPSVCAPILCCMSPDNRFLATLLPQEVSLMLVIWDSKSSTKSQIINLGSYKGSHFSRIMYMPQTDEHMIMQFKSDKHHGFWLVNLGTACVENKLLLPLDTPPPKVLYLTKSLIVLRVSGQQKIFNYSTGQQALEYKDLHGTFYFTPSDKYIIAPKLRSKFDSTKLDNNLRLIHMSSGENACILECHLSASCMFANNRSEILFIGCKSYGIIFRYDIGNVAKRDIRKMKPSLELSLANQLNMPDDLKTLYDKYTSMTQVVSLSTAVEDKYLLAEYNISDIKNIYVVWNTSSKQVQAVFLKLLNDVVRFANDGSYIYQFIPNSGSFTSLVVFNTFTGELIQESNHGQPILDIHVMKAGSVLTVLADQLILSNLKKIDEQNTESELQIQQYTSSLPFPKYNSTLNIVYANSTSTADFTYFNLDTNCLFSVPIQHDNPSLATYPIERHITPDGSKLILIYGSKNAAERLNAHRDSISAYIMQPNENKKALIQSNTDLRKPEIPGVNYFTGNDGKSISSLRNKQSEKTNLNHADIYEQHIIRVIDTSTSDLICQISLAGEQIMHVTNNLLMTFKPDYASLLSKKTLHASDIISLYDLSSGLFQASIYLDHFVIGFGLLDNNTKLLVCCGKQGRWIKLLSGDNFDKVIHETDLDPIMKTYDEYARSVHVRSIHIFYDNSNSILINYFWKSSDKEHLYAKIDLFKKDLNSQFTAIDVIKDVTRDGRWGIDRHLRIYDLNRGDLVKQLNLTTNYDFENINCVTKFTDDGYYIVVVDNNSQQMYVIRNEAKNQMQMSGKALLHKILRDNNETSPYNLALGQGGRVAVVFNNTEFKVMVIRDQGKRLQEAAYTNVTTRAKYLMPKKQFNNLDNVFGKRLTKDPSRRASIKRPSLRRSPVRTIGSNKSPVSR